MGPPALRNWRQRLVAAAHSIRFRLLGLALAPLAIVLPLLVAMVATWGSQYFDRLLVTKVRSDLAVAHEYFGRVEEGIGRGVAAVAGSGRLIRALTQERSLLDDLLREARQANRLDFLLLLDTRGRVALGGEAGLKGQGLAEWPVVRQALAERPGQEVEVLSAELLARLDPRLAAQAHTPILATVGASPDDRQAETRGLVIRAAAPVLSTEGRLLGVLAGGVLLNKNLDFVDRLNDVVYPEDALPRGSHGTATLFLGDVRIATNVRLFEGERAIGTRVSTQVRDAVLTRGTTWLDRAFVVNDWYVSAYRPITDSRGMRVGMLYVGFLEAPLAVAKRGALALIIGLFALAMAGSAVVSVLLARKVFRPIERMHQTMSAIEAGQVTARVGEMDTGDELGQLAGHFDRLLDRLQRQAEALQQWGESLDQEVARRTAELSAAVTQLRAAQNQLVVQEKLAAIGQLTAGVAHEVNNPVAVIQGNVELIRELLGPERCAPVEGEIRLIQEQVHRIRLIVAKLLQFARPTEYVGYVEPVAPRVLMQDSLLLVGHLLRRGHVAVEQQFESLRQVTCNRSELQQVLINLLVNAIQAMPEGGTLRLVLDNWDEADMPIGVRIAVSDTGPGIAPEHLEKLFRPFFTVDKPGGTGLGLWVSQSIVERYGGRITAESAPGQGTTFRVWLREEPLAGG